MIGNNECPYKNLPDYSYWRRSLKNGISEVDPVVSAGFSIDKDTKVAAAGSCFAQHISRYLERSGYNYFVTETGPEFFPKDVLKDFNYGTFSSRFGNIYTAKQLNQLFDRAFGNFEPVETFWLDNGRYIDPFRPLIQPEGFDSYEELCLDVERHLSAVREMFLNLDVFVFTMGLTEGWLDKRDGAVYPVCPGCSVGQYDDSKYEFFNQSYDEVMFDMSSFFKKLKEINPSAQMLLTVSPVPLMATFEDRHVIVSTTVSKSILRVVADVLASQKDIHYFPSFEIITGNYNKGAYYENDLRSVREEGVAHVMKLFLKYYTDASDNKITKTITRMLKANSGTAVVELEVSNVADVVCDEELSLSSL